MPGIVYALYLGKMWDKKLVIMLFKQVYSMTLKVSIYAELKGNLYSIVSDDV
jgi:hypothetical protein